jgi:UDP-glucose 4-epimerase
MTTRPWIITGGAGYIGSHIADEFLSSGIDVVVYDSLEGGLESRIEYLRKKHKKEIPLIVGDIRNSEFLAGVLKRIEPEGVIHAAALKSVSESLDKPDLYLEVNFEATKKILTLVTQRGIKNFVFASSAAVYGSTDGRNPIRENDSKDPISPYGASKLAAEKVVSSFLLVPGNFGTSLRFFNVVGTIAPELMDRSIDNLVPIVIKKLRSGETPIIFGTDYQTPDGTCVRDYVDVRDVARAHLKVATSKITLPLVMNVGTGRGESVREVIRIVGQSFRLESVNALESNRRPGDPESLFADVTLISKSIGFEPLFSLKESIESMF